MDNLGRRLIAFATAVVILLVSGCVDEPRGAPPTKTLDASATKQPEVAAGEVVREVGGNEYGVTVQSLKSDGTNLELKLAVRIVKEGPKWSALVEKWSSVLRSSVPDRLRIIDFENDEVLEVGSITQEGQEKTKFSASEFSEPKPAPSELTAYFANPRSDRVSLLMPFLGLINDIPVTRIEQNLNPGDPVDELSVYYYGTYSVQQVSAPFESEATVSVDNEKVLISMPSDILFEFGSAELSTQAVAAIETVTVSIIEYSTEGELRVVGHTDDQGNDDINRPLSTDRANAVAILLQSTLPAGRYSTQVAGKGSDQPVMEGTSEEARAANRRVEIEFEYAPPAVQTEPALIQPTVPPLTAQGHGLIEGYYEDNSVQVTKVERANGYLFASFLLTQTSTEGGLIDTPFKNHGPKAGAAFSELWESLHGIGKATLLTSTSRVFPVGYRTAPEAGRTGNDEGRWRSLGDRNLLYFIAGNTSLTATVIWPDPGTDTITVDIADRWRITDIPVVDSKGE